MIRASKLAITTPRPISFGKKLIKLDIACGQRKQQGFIGIDIAKTKDADIVHDLLKFPWPIKSESVEEAHCSHFFEHVPGLLRMPFMDECYRILTAGAKLTVICPYYASSRAVQDPTHAWPPITEATFLYFNKGWMKANALDHYPVNCDFDFTYGYAADPETAAKAEGAQQFWVKHYINAISDIHVTLTKRAPEK